ncbi:polysaccharide pyruvyl transferase family protein [Gordonia jacobaea]|uniref:polysaccharide pyruvyl transferase family protein n=1 Tax=Gordonia jacobaea TaxID=122202 RepID=UPI003D7118CB
MLTDEFSSRRLPSNFGDQVSPIVFSELTGVRTTWAPIQKADFVCIGSILNSYMRKNCNAIIFGSGLRDPNSIVAPIDTSRIVGVRGEQTVAAMPDDSVQAIGDPALAIRAMPAFNPVNRKRSGVIALPHFSSYANRTIRKRLGDLSHEGVEVLAPNTHPVEVARIIRQSDLVLTSSLHGQIFADALGTRAVRVNFGPSSESDFKFEDYSSVFGLGNQAQSVVNFTGARLSELHAIADNRRSRIAERIDGVVDNLYRLGRQL